MTIYETIYEQNYRLMNKIFDIERFINRPLEAEIKLKSNGYMDLVIEKIDDNAISMTHYYKMNGDLVPDPDMEIRVYQEQKMVEALSYQDSYAFHAVYPELNTIDLKLKKELNSFLRQWLKNLIEQGFREET